MPAETLEIMLADDHPVVLAGIRSLVLVHEDLRIVGEAQDGLAALEMAKDIRPHIVVLDISMPGMKGTSLAEELRQHCPGSKLVVLTVHEDRGYLRQLLESGVSGYVLKRSAADDLVKAIRIAAAGGIYIDPSLKAMAFGSSVSGALPSHESNTTDLSSRELEVLRLLAEGHSNKSVAARLNIAIKTAETYKSRAFEKLGLQSRVELIRYAATKGWLDRM
jgi:DNA-binding NarL/FixJ family response regulator